MTRKEWNEGKSKPEFQEMTKEEVEKLPGGTYQYMIAEPLSKDFGEILNSPIRYAFPLYVKKELTNVSN